MCELIGERVNLDKLRILNAGFTEREYQFYGFDSLSEPQQAMSYLSQRANVTICRPCVNRGDQQHILEDKWVAQKFFHGLGLPTPHCLGLYHPMLGVGTDTTQLRNSTDFLRVLGNCYPQRLVFKPRGGRQGSNVIVAEVSQEDITGNVTVRSEGIETTLDSFLENLPMDVFEHYDGSYQGWIVQGYIPQHSVLNEICPYTVNTVRVVTLLDAQNRARTHSAVLRLGREGSPGDNWATGGVAVGLDVGSGKMADGVFKPKYGGEWVSAHPDSGCEFRGRTVPFWKEILEVCNHAAEQFPGVRSVGWDIAVTESGPFIVEGNSDWDLAIMQVHSLSGFLTEDFRAELAELGANFDRELPSTLPSLLAYALKRLKQSRLGFLVRGRR